MFVSFRSVLNLSFAILLLSCHSNSKSGSPKREEAEKRAQGYIAKARSLLYRHDYESARMHIRDMRKSCAYALNAREEGIILLDSIDLCEAQSHLHRIDSLMHNAPQHQRSIRQQQLEKTILQVKFYLHKIQHDKQQRQQHD